MIRILIVDDHAMLLEGITLALEREHDIRIVGTAQTMAGGLSLAASLEPDIIVIDYRLGGDSGVELARALRSADPSAVLVGMSATSSSTIIDELVAAGCCSFVHKQRGISALANAIRDAHDGVSHLPRQTAAATGGQERLSPREIQVLQLMSEGRVPADIATHLLLSVHTVRNHIREIRRKLDVSSQLAAVAAGIRTGLIKGPGLD